MCCWAVAVQPASPFPARAVPEKCINSPLQSPHSAVRSDARNPIPLRVLYISTDSVASTGRWMGISLNRCSAVHFRSPSMPFCSCSGCALDLDIECPFVCASFRALSPSATRSPPSSSSSSSRKDDDGELMRAKMREVDGEGDKQQVSWPQLGIRPRGKSEQKDLS